MQVQSGIGFDVHPFAPDRQLILGGVTVPHEFGLAGHSDADVLCHAVMDALLGAAADGDIGAHFPDSDPQWKDARSLELLESVARRLEGQGAQIIHVDATVVAEAPHLAPHRDALRRNLADAMHMTVEHVSVKATTAEQMGALGREEGIAVIALATISVPGRGDDA